LFWRRESRGQDFVALECKPCGGRWIIAIREQLRNAKIKQLYPAIVCNQHIGRFDIAVVDDPSTYDGKMRDMLNGLAAEIMKVMDDLLSKSASWSVSDATAFVSRFESSCPPHVGNRREKVLDMLKLIEWAKRNKAHKARTWTNAQLARAHQLLAPQVRTQDQLQCYREP